MNKKLFNLRKELKRFVLLLYGMGLINDDNADNINYYLETGLISDKELKDIFDTENKEITKNDKLKALETLLDKSLKIKYCTGYNHDGDLIGKVYFDFGTSSIFYNPSILVCLEVIFGEKR